MLDAGVEIAVGECAANVSPSTMVALVTVESDFNPYAIGVVGGRLERQPTTKEEAVATATRLKEEGRNFSMGLGQVNIHNLEKYGLSFETVFNSCDNIRVSGEILTECFDRATLKFSNKQAALQAAFSCYYSGNFSRGFSPDKAGDKSYVQKIVAATPSGRVSATNDHHIPDIKNGAVYAPSKQVALSESDRLQAIRLNGNVVVTSAQKSEGVMAW